MAENVGNKRPKTQGEILREAGYSETISENPQKIIQTDSFQDLLAIVMPDDELTAVHKRLLQTRKIEHMVFPLGPEGEDDPDLSGANPNDENGLEKAGVKPERTTLTDVEIKEMLSEVNCQVRRIVHGLNARHVYYWAHDASAQAKALELVYKIKGVIQKDGGGGDNVNFNFGTQNFVKKVEVKP